MVSWFYYRYVHRRLMRWMHKHDLHYMPEIGPLLPGGEYQKWCKWCGLRVSYHKHYATYIMGRDAVVAFDLPKKKS